MQKAFKGKFFQRTPTRKLSADRASPTFVNNGRILILFTLFLLVTTLSDSVVASDQATAFRETIQEKLATTPQNDALLTINGHKLHGASTIKKIYALNDYYPLWSAEAIQQLVDQIDASELDGLTKTDYLAGELSLFKLKQQQDKLNPDSRAIYELLLTESLLRLGYHLRFGKVDPVSLDSNWNYKKRLDMKDPATAVYRAIKNQAVNALLDKQRPTHASYRNLQKVLSDYLRIEQQGGWQSIAPGKTIRPGDSSDRIPQIRRRLAITGDYQQDREKFAALNVYDSGLREAVLAFQARHGLAVDGLIGNQTLAAMNVPVTDRIDQIRINLERLRWIMQEISDNYLLVDIAGFEAYLVQDGKQIWRENAVVGKAYTETPVFKGTLKYVEFNPTWTIPPVIIKNTVLPALKKDPRYIAKKGYVLLDFKGNPVDPLSIDWKNQTRFPYMVRQPAGKNNALGLVKFIFPNPHFVFLHDTNHRELFNRTVRTFSSGCIRVENPFKLAELLLAPKPGWEDGSKVYEVIASEKTKRVKTPQQIPVLITYTTVGIDDAGQAVFKPDIYNRDPAVLKGLQGPITVAADVREKVREFDVMRNNNQL